jgi:hypothetical protein
MLQRIFVVTLAASIVASCAAGELAETAPDIRNPEIREVDTGADSAVDGDAVQTDVVEEADVPDASDTAEPAPDAPADTAVDAETDEAATDAVDAPSDTATDSTDSAEPPDAPDAPDAPDVVDAVDAPDVADVPDLVDATDVVDTTDTTDVADVPDLADVPDVIDVPDVPLGPAERGSYLHGRLEIGGLRRLARAAIPVQSDLLLLAESYDIVHVHSLVDGTTVPVDLGPAGSSSFAYFEDIAFSPDGTYGLLMGQIINGTTKTGVLWMIDAAVLRDESAEPATAFRQLTGLPAANAWAAVTWPADPDGLPVLLSRNEGTSYNFALRRFDPATETLTIIGAQPSGAGCQDVEFVNNELGREGLLVVCGINGYDAWYWTSIGGVGEWRTGLSGLGNNNLGNTSRIAVHPSRDYALLVSWSGRSVYRFQNARLNSYSAAPRFSTLGIWTGVFSPDGRRALVAGGLSVADNGIALEYRHDLYPCTGSLGSASCNWTDVSVLSMTGPPWAAPDNSQLNDIAWRHDCDGGVMVGGYSNFEGSRGVLVTFELEGGQPCW